MCMDLFFIQRKCADIFRWLLLILLLLATNILFAQPQNNTATTGSSSPSPRPLKTIIVANYFPYTFENDQGKPDGFSVELSREIAIVMGRNLEISVDTWEHAMQALENETIDFLPMMAASPERKKSFDFSIPHTIAFDAIFTRVGVPEIESIDALADKSILVMKNDAAHEYLIASGIASKANLVYIESLSDALKKLDHGIGDAAIMPELVGLLEIQKLKLNNIDLTPTVIEGYSRPFCFAVKKGNQSLLERFNQGYGIVRSTGQYEIIYKKWFGSVDSSSISWKKFVTYLATILVIAVVIGLTLLLWNMSLKKQVALRTARLEAEILERKRTEAALRLTKFVVDNASDAIFWIASDARIVDANAAGCKSLGYTHEELVQRFVTDIDVNYNAEKWPQHFAEIRQRGSIKFESVQRTKDGRLVPIEVVANYIRFDENELNCAFVRDITERKSTEMTLAAEKEQLAVTLRSIGDGVITSDTQGNVVIMNRVAEHLTGWTQSEARGNPLATVFNIINEVTRQPCESPVIKVLATGTSYQREFVICAFRFEDCL
ncbi:MAG: transporter substrate-binding domain-containing protein [Candidatus Riflebacteria bacterium]|nr:transporter substrate-binding domain-containing protein [Candidatus Riflebacteria bacterium]